MKLTLQLQLLPDANQKPVLLATMERYNEAATFAAKLGFEARRLLAAEHPQAGLPGNQGPVSVLSAQMAVRAIGKAVECVQAR